ncbi:MAG TPA: hypothetical protein VF451_05635 [Acidobacteriota bacterium]
MRKTFLSVLGALFLGGLLCGPLCRDVEGQALDDVMDMYYKAHGGLDKLKAVTAIKMSGKLFIPAQGLELPTVRWQKAPDKLRVETEIQDKKVIQGFDGRTAWWLNPMLAPGAQEMPQEQAALFREQAEFADPLVAFKEKGGKLELLGREELDGKPAFKLRLTKADGKEIYFYLDAESGVGLKSSRAMTAGDAASMAEIIYTDYRPVDGQLVPFVIENRTGGKTQARLVLGTVELNPAMDDSLFSMPVKKDAPKAQGRKK